MAMGDELVRAVSNPNVGLPKLTMDSVDQILKDTKK